MQQQLSFLNDHAKWFNELPIWKQFQALVETYNVIDLLKGLKQSQRVWWHLQEFGQITNMQCHELYGIRHCPSVIRDIRQKLIEDGDRFRIVNEHKTGCDKFGNECKFDVYKLEKTDKYTEY